MPKTVVITGAGRGIGRATARAFAAEGATVVVASRTAAELQSLVAEIAAAGGRAVAVPCDIGAEPDVIQLMAQASALHGRIDVLVCAAGVAAIAPFEQLALADWERTLQVGLTGTFLCCKHASPHMAAGGLIVALGSIAGRSGFPHWSAYSAAKFGLTASPRPSARSCARGGFGSAASLPPPWIRRCGTRCPASGTAPICCSPPRSPRPSSTSPARRPTSRWTR